MREVINVAIVEDQKSFITGLSSVLKNYNITINETALNGKEFFQKLEENRIASEIVLLDIEMPEMDGSEVLDVIKRKYSHLKVIIITHYDDEELIRDFFNRGVNAYVPKGTDVEVMVEAIREVKKGGTYRDNLNSLFKRTQERNKKNALKMLYSNREREIIVRLCKGKPVAEIAKELHVIEKTIESHLTDIYKKSRTKNRAEFLIYAIKDGLNYLGDG